MPIVLIRGTSALTFVLGIHQKSPDIGSWRSMRARSVLWSSSVQSGSSFLRTPRWWSSDSAARCMAQGGISEVLSVADVFFMAALSLFAVVVGP